jgi:hypothetical protein
MKQSEARTRAEAGSADAKPLLPEELQVLWEALGGANTAQAYEAGLTLRSAPRSAVRYLQEQLRPARAAAPFHPRQLARALRAIDVLVQINTSDSRKLLQALATGAADSPVTEAARAALARRSLLFVKWAEWP